MARIGGRSNWIAVPAGMLCAAVVAGLVWLALPMFPVTVAWVGDTLRAASAPRPTSVAAPTPADRAAAAKPLDCRALYPDSLWSELTWRGGVLLTQTAGPPATAVASLADALEPSSRVTCAWRLQGGGGIVTTLAAVPEDAATIADAALRGQGFTCTMTGGVVQCIRVRGVVIEEHTVRGGLWLSSMETAWHPSDYGVRVAAQVWNPAPGYSSAAGH
ncbi:hypothetical protein [Microbacterium deminutum]|uniref:Uncharacterized protein n=1 Tax=Microbacterium deminutum TaxID=344164 RepID=A0ABN2Q6Q7_9MICO